jgi:hypothetical protein
MRTRFKLMRLCPYGWYLRVFVAGYMVKSWPLFETWGEAVQAGNRYSSGSRDDR